MVLSRILAALAYAGAAFLFGILLGERGELGVVQLAFAFIIPLVTVVLAILARQGRPEVLLTGLLMFAGLRYGQFAFARAWTDCPSHAPAVRAEIVRFHARTGDYPARLRDLGTELPCACVFRKTILHYAANERRFRLWISNDSELRSF